MKDYSDIIGPVFLYWISQLHEKLTFLGAERGRKVLYCARAGKRIQDLVEAYAGKRPGFESELFGISRIGACKLGIGEAETFDTAFDITYESLAGATIGDVCKAYLRHSWDDADQRMRRLADLRQPLDKPTFRAFIAANDADARWFRDQLSAARDGFLAALEQSLGAHSGFVLVDSGWKASIQRMLVDVFPQFGFEGLYFGVMDARPLEQRFGIVFDAPNYVPGRPASVFAAHRHLIETILEANAPSVEELVGGAGDAIARAQIAAVANERPDAGKDALFLSLRDYVARNSEMPPDEVLAAHRQALGRIVPLLLNPSRADALALAGKARSIDFGRTGEVPVLSSPRQDTEDSRDLRIQRSLWPQGQIALEYESADVVRRMQDRVTQRSNTADYFTSHESTGRKGRAAEAAKGKPDDWIGSVAVVTRTKDRPLLLRRAARSVAAQTYRNFRWVVVNDGGESTPVIEIIRNSGVDMRRVILVDNPESVGMEAASNMGVRSCDTEFVVIHDDDDSWEPDFLRESVDFLSSARAVAAGFEGVVSRAWRVSEQIARGRVIFHKKTPYMPWVSEVSISQMAVGNFFAPISFLYRRWVFDDIGGYDETLPVLGDWRFNLDFLMRGNIAFMDKYLAYYHHRDRDDFGRDIAYSNSVVGAQGLHAQYFSVVTNGILRNPRTPPGLIAALVAGHQQRVIEMQVSKVVRDDPNKTSTPLSGRGSGASLQNIPEEDLHHIKQNMRSAMPFGVSPRRTLARLRWEWRMLVALNGAGPANWLLRLLPVIPSHPDFDHIAYLRLHPEIWATVYNGPNELLPYHHYLIEGIVAGFERPRMSDIKDRP